MSRTAIITQSNYIPWKGYFDNIAAVDLFVVYDDMQYTKRDWRNRNLIKSAEGLIWLTIPVEVKGKYFQKIREVKVADKQWAKLHWDRIKLSYKNAPHFKEMAEWIAPLYLNCDLEYLTDINLSFIQAINQFLGIRTEIRYSSEFKLHEDRNQRLVDICKDADVTGYYSGPAAKAYMDTGLFEQNGISVHYFDYTGYPEYKQLYEGFEHGVTIFDLIFNAGPDTANYMKFKNKPHG